MCARLFFCLSTRACFRVSSGCQGWRAAIGRSTRAHALSWLGANDGLDLLERVDRKESLSSQSVKASGNRASVGVGRRARRAGQPPGRGLRVSSSRFRRCRCSRKPWKQKTRKGRAFGRGRAARSNARSRDTRAEREARVVITRSAPPRARGTRRARRGSAGDEGSRGCFGKTAEGTRTFPGKN